MIRIPIGLVGVAAAVWVLKTSRFVHEPQHVKWVIAGVVMLPFVILAELLVRRAKAAKAARRRPVQRTYGSPFGPR